ncbi:MAG: hypothetical protein RBJ76_17100 [Stenomitos frigidus ULC029]
MAKTPLMLWRKQSLSKMYSRQSFLLGASLLLSVMAIAVGSSAASAQPGLRVPSNGYATPGKTITFPPVRSYHGAGYYPFRRTVRPVSGFGLSIQIGTPTYYPSDVYPSGDYPSGYTYRQRRLPPQGSVNNSVLLNPTVINGSIRNSTLVNPTIVTTPNAPEQYYPEQFYPGQAYPTQAYPRVSYPAPYYNVRTVIPTVRPEPQVVIDPQYGVRYQAPFSSTERQVIVDPQYGVRYSNPSGY